MKIGSCFSGVGAMDLGVSEFFGADTSTAWFIERESYPREVLARQFPGVPCYKDITAIDPADLEPVDIMIGGPPCTDLSVAGSGAGLHGPKSRLFFDMVNIAKVLQPRYVMIENSPVLLDKWRGTVEGAFEDAGYGVTWARLSAAHVGAPHLRWRCFLLAELGGTHKGVCFPPALPRLDRWPTPTASGSGGSEDLNKWHDRQKRVSPSVSMGADPRFIPLGIAARWPTPSASQHNDSESLESFFKRQDRASASSGHPKYSVPLPVAARWPTPTVSSGDQHALAPTPAMTGGTTLGGAVRWATPAASDVLGSRTLPPGTSPTGIKPDGKKAMVGLPNMVERRWATPAARDHKDSGHEVSQQARNAPALTCEAVMGTDDKAQRLSPAWCEILQGLPVNWTALGGDLDPRPWPAHRIDGMWGDSPQHDHEPPRLCDPKTVLNRRARLKALGNLNPPQVYTRALEMLTTGPRQGMLFD